MQTCLMALKFIRLAYVCHKFLHLYWNDAFEYKWTTGTYFMASPKFSLNYD